jgi:hypothetical protein
LHWAANLEFGPVKLSLRAAHLTTWRRQLGPVRQPLRARASQLLRAVITDGRGPPLSHTISAPLALLLHCRMGPTGQWAAVACSRTPSSPCSWAQQLNRARRIAPAKIAGPATTTSSPDSSAWSINASQGSRPPRITPSPSYFREPRERERVLSAAATGDSRPGRRFGPM